MRYFDLHCDTITQCFTQNKSLAENDLQIDLKRAGFLETYVQCYAVWLPDRFHGPAAFDRFSGVAERLFQEVRENSGDLSLYHGDSEKSRCQAILTVENASALGGNIENAGLLGQMGVKLCSLTWNGENELGRGVMAPGSTGITAFGREVVACLEKQQISIDVSHASRARSICGHPRNLSDDQFAAIKDSHGLVGINLYKGFLNDDPQKAGWEDVLRHVEHFLSLGGEDVLAFGADLDGGAREDFAAAGIEALEELYEVFLRQNYKKSLIDKIFYQNAADFFQKENSR